MSLIAPSSTLPLFASVAPRDEDSRPIDPLFITAPTTTLERRFADFHARNPQIYKALEQRARVLLESGRGRVGIAELVEELRYDYRMKSDGDAFKVNNSFRAFYARLLIYKDLRFDGVIETRTQTNARKEKQGASA